MTPMLNRILGAGTSPELLKEGLGVSARRIREVAERVANASSGDFATDLDAAQAGAIDVEQEMVTLADEQLRFDAASRLLQKMYAQIRSSVRER